MTRHLHGARGQGRRSGKARHGDAAGDRAHEEHEGRRSLYGEAHAEPERHPAERMVAGPHRERAHDDDDEALMKEAMLVDQAVQDRLAADPTLKIVPRSTASSDFKNAYAKAKRLRELLARAESAAASAPSG